MKAAIREIYCDPKDIEIKDIETAIPDNDEIVIKVYASTVNRTDQGVLRAKPFIMRLFTGLIAPKRPILGTDFAGVVEDIGEGIENFEVGDRVFGFFDEGACSHAEYLVYSTKKAISIIPKNIDFKRAAASLEGAHYAYNFIKKTNLKKGDKVMVNGGTGAIGSAMIQILRHYGAHITATAPGDYLDNVKELGASKVINYEKENFTLIDDKFDFVFDAVGKSSFSKCKRILKENGIYISSELGKNCENIFYSLFTPLFSKKKVLFPLPLDIQGSIDFIKKLIEDGEFKPLIDKVYPFEEISKAYEHMETGKKIGNIIVEIN